MDITQLTIAEIERTLEKLTEARDTLVELLESCPEMGTPTYGDD